MIIGHQQFGSGPRRVVVLNDWLSDTSTWDDARRYLDGDAFTWLFADLRGYGRSKEMTGEHTVREAAGDVLDLAGSLGWNSFSVVGHSMSSLIALHLAQQHADRVDRVAVLCPPPPAGFGADADTLAGMQQLALGDDDARVANLVARWGDRLSAGWIRHKLARWRETSDANAVAAYCAMFGRDGMPDATSPVGVPVLAVTGEQDWEMMRAAVVSSFLAPLCTALSVVPLADSGHYPMQELPPLTVSVIERFLSTS